MTLTKKIGMVILFVVIAMQFVRPTKNSSEAIQHSDLLTNFLVPSDVASIFKTSCYDCHSNNTNYPWYLNIQPVGWLLANHIKEGKAAFDFHEFYIYSQRRQVSKLKAVHNSIKDGSMPLVSYTFLHGDAELSDEEKTLLLSWTSKTIDSLSERRNKRRK